MSKHRAPAPRVDFRIYLLFAAVVIGALAAASPLGQLVTI